MILTNDPKQNLQMIKLIALRSFPNDIIRAQLTAAQAILESNLLGKPSILASKYNNLFGIKGRGNHKPPSYLLETQEHSDKEGWHEVHALFAWNDSLEESFDQFLVISLF